MQSKLNGDLILYNKKDDIVIDKLIYLKIVETIRKIHMFKRNNQMPANERTKMDLIEDDRDECEMRKNQEYKSVLIPIISTIVASIQNQLNQYLTPTTLDSLTIESVLIH